MKRILWIAGFLCVISAMNIPLALAEQPVGKQLTGAEIKKALIGNTARYLTRKGIRLDVFWNESGTMYAKSESAAARGRASGSWKITEDNFICSSWNSSKMESGCRSLYLDEKTGQIQTYNREGSPVANITEILPGNPEKLE